MDVSVPKTGETVAADAELVAMLRRRDPNFDVEKARATLERRDLRRAAYHEAGHMVLVQRFGGEADARIFPAEDGSLTTSFWSGCCRIFSEPGVSRLSSHWRRVRNCVRTPKNWTTLVGLGGIIAELIDVGLDDLDDVYEEALEAADGGLLSRTDLELIGRRFTRRDVGAAVAALRACWDRVSFEAELMIRGNPVPSPWARRGATS